MPPLVRIRPELREEAPALRGFIREAFRTAPKAEGDEPEFVDRLRDSAGYVPELALVAERGTEIVGHIIMTRMPPGTIAGDVLFLAELSVRLDVRRRGVGSGLVREALSRAANFGKAVLVVGEPEFYERFGFAPAIRFDLANAEGGPAASFQALELLPDALAGGWGRVHLPR